MLSFSTSEQVIQSGPAQQITDLTSFISLKLPNSSHPYVSNSVCVCVCVCVYVCVFVCVRACECVCLTVCSLTIVNFTYIKMLQAKRRGIDHCFCYL